MTKRADELTYYAELPIGHGGQWRFRARVQNARSSGEVSTEVEATPDGVLSPWMSLIYLVPFAALGGLWVLVAIRRCSPR